MENIAKQIVEAATSELMVLRDMFDKASSEDRVDDAIKLAGAIARIKRDAYQVEAQANASVRAMSVVMPNTTSPVDGNGAPKARSIGDLARLASGRKAGNNAR